MKTTLLTLFLIAGLVTAAAAQTGLRLGYNSATIGGDASGVSATSGYHVGLFFLKRNPNNSTMFEILYSAQGTQSASGGTKISYKYILLPFLMNFYLNDQVFAQLGVQPGILVGADVNGQSVIDQLNTFDFAGALGLGVDLEQFILNARYNYGFTTTSKQSTGHFPNMVFQLSAGIKFGSRKSD